MAGVLVAWEFGANLGHLAQLLPLAERLRAKGHRITFALRDVTRADEILGRRGFDYLQAPVWHPRPQPFSFAPCNFSEILEHYGYADREGLLGMVKAWREIYRLVDPQILMFEHAPTALLASRGVEAVRILYGPGFYSPPRVAPFPNFRTWEAIAPKRLEESDARVVATINDVLRKLRLRPLDFAHELFDVDHDFLCTFSELDPYVGRSEPTYCGSVFARDDGATANWPEGSGKRVYVYLRCESRAFTPVAEALSDGGHSVLCFAPDVTARTAHRFESARFTFLREPARLGDVASSADAAVVIGGHETVSALLLGGVPLALFPLRVEQVLVAHSVAALRAGALALRQASVEDMQSALSAVLDDRLKEGAQAFATRYRGHEPRDAVTRVAYCVERYCGMQTL